MKCVVIDDEPLAIKILKGYVEKVPLLELEATFTNPFKAWEYLARNPVDLIFLDINMPGLTGLQLVQTLSGIHTKIIFTTAYSEYALEGFNLDIVDYLLKPIAFDRFLKAVNKAQRTAQSATPVLNPATQAIDDYLLVKSEHRLIKIFYKDIYYIEGYKDYVKIYTNEDKPLLTLKSLKSLEEQLTEHGFIRIHKSYLVSIPKIKEIRSGKVKLKEKFLTISDSYKEVFAEKVTKGKI